MLVVSVLKATTLPASSLICPTDAAAGPQSNHTMLMTRSSGVPSVGAGSTEVTRYRRLRIGGRYLIRMEVFPRKTKGKPGPICFAAQHALPV